MSHDQRDHRQQALRSLDRLVGTWNASDPSGRGGISGQTRFEWMKGDEVLLQWIDFGGAVGLEVIAFDDASSTLRSHYFDRHGGILEYTYALDGDQLTIRIDMDGRSGRFLATFAADGNSLEGEWIWTQNGKPHSYRARLDRA